MNKTINAGRIVSHYETFKIQLNSKYVVKGDVIMASDDVGLLVLRAYKHNCWRKFLVWIGIPTNIGLVKVKQIY